MRGPQERIDEVIAGKDLGIPNLPSWIFESLWKVADEGMTPTLALLEYSYDVLNAISNSLGKICDAVSSRS